MLYFLGDCRSHVRERERGFLGTGECQRVRVLDWCTFPWLCWSGFHRPLWLNVGWGPIDPIYPRILCSESWPLSTASCGASFVSPCPLGRDGTLATEPENTPHQSSKTPSQMASHYIPLWLTLSTFRYTVGNVIESMQLVTFNVKFRKRKENTQDLACKMNCARDVVVRRVHWSRILLQYGSGPYST